MDRKDLFDILQIEARRRGWAIGEYESANWWFKKRWNPLMEAMQRGGVRALDNLLPPVLRDYSDLAPFEILVGDQHRFDRWVMDDETGEVFRPEGYLWQDLRTRIIYGAAVDKKYDAWLIGLALRLGIACYGAFGSIYTDNGKPELSKYVTGILANMRALGMEWQRTQEATLDLLDVDDEDVRAHYTIPGTHIKAVVKNAKAKMIEGTFYRLERIMASVLKLAGQTKRLGDDIHWQDVDHGEAMKLAQLGRLLTSREFALAMYLACDHYNSKKAHRGVLSEWAWTPRPKEATPADCLMAAYNNDAWKPRMISKDAADLLFLARGSRTVNKGRITFANDFYEHDALMELHGQRLDIRYNPMTLDELHVFQGAQYLCTAAPVERSSMKDLDLASRKIAEKRERRKKFAEEFRRIAAIAPDFREYSKVPEAERVAVLIGEEKRKRAAAQIEFNRPVTQEELDAHIEKMEQGLPLPLKSPKPLPERPGSFATDITRFLWILDVLKAGVELTAEDEAFKQKYLAEQSPGQRDYYEFMIEGFGG
jgi:putative transposase